jgi:hypothetical protein
LNKDDDEYLFNWVEGYFKNDYSKAIFYTLATNFNFSNNEFDYHYKLVYLDRIGAYENIVEEHDNYFRFESTKIDTMIFNMYCAGHFPYYFKSMLNVNENDYKKIRILIKYVDLLLKISEVLNNNIDNIQYFKSNKQSLLQYKARAMQELPEFTERQICELLKLAKEVDVTQEIWVESNCKLY